MASAKASDTNLSSALSELKEERDQMVIGKASKGLTPKSVWEALAKRTLEGLTR